MTPLRKAIAGSIRSIFVSKDAGDQQAREDAAVMPGAGERPYMPADAVVRDVHRDVTVMMVGGVRALLLQMLHPLALAGVWDHSNFRADMPGRLRRTARFIAVTTYGGEAAALAAIGRVNAIHSRIVGIDEDGTPYAASDPALLAWVHATEADSFLAAHLRYREPMMRASRRDRYCAEMAVTASRLGVEAPPRTTAQLREAIRASRPALRAGARSREAAGILLSHVPASPALRPAQALVMAAAIDLLPDWARRMHGLSQPAIATPAIRAGTAGMGGMIRWAMAAG